MNNFFKSVRVVVVLSLCAYTPFLQAQKVPSQREMIKRYVAEYQPAQETYTPSVPKLNSDNRYKEVQTPTQVPDSLVKVYEENGKKELLKEEKKMEEHHTFLLKDYQNNLANRGKKIRKRRPRRTRYVYARGRRNANYYGVYGGFGQRAYWGNGGGNSWRNDPWNDPWQNTYNRGGGSVWPYIGGVGTGLLLGGAFGCW